LIPGVARASAKSNAALTAVNNWAIAAVEWINDFKANVHSPTEQAPWIDASVKVLCDTCNVLETQHSGAHIITTRRFLQT
jgi:hypothetical protein